MEKSKTLPKFNVKTKKKGKINDNDSKQLVSLKSSQRFNKVNVINEDSRNRNLEKKSLNKAKGNGKIPTSGSDRVIDLNEEQINEQNENENKKEENLNKGDSNSLKNSCKQISFQPTKDSLEKNINNLDENKKNNQIDKKVIDIDKMGENKKNEINSKKNNNNQKTNNEITQNQIQMYNQLTNKPIPSTNVKVFARFRPVNSMEKDLLDTNVGTVCVEYLYPGKQYIDIDEEDKKKECKSVKLISPSGGESHPFHLDRVFDSNSDQLEVYNYFGPSLVKDVLNGYNGTVFAYGQSGSGKTYTMYGDDIYDDNIKGFIPRLVTDIFDYAENTEENVTFQIKMSFLQIYKEVIYDLLTGENNLKIKENPLRGIFVEKLTEVCISSLPDFMYYVEIGNQNRYVSETKLNTYSSRSHSILILEISQTLNSDNYSKSGKLNLVDLAGSEKVSKSGAIGETLEEAKKINWSLSALGNVIHALTTNADHIPYRDSKLTRILQESLGGNFKTSLIVTCSPHSYNIDETTSTLNFAVRAKKIKNNAKMNIKLTYQELQVIVKQLKAKLNMSMDEIKHLKTLIPEDVLIREEEKRKKLMEENNNNDKQNGVIIKKNGNNNNNNEQCFSERSKSKNKNENSDSESEIEKKIKKSNHNRNTNDDKITNNTGKNNKLLNSDVSSVSIGIDNEPFSISDNNVIFGKTINQEIEKYDINSILQEKRQDLTNGDPNNFRSKNSLYNSSSYSYANPEIKEELESLSKLNDDLIIEKLKIKIDKLTTEIKEKNQQINKIEKEALESEEIEQKNIKEIPKNQTKKAFKKVEFNLDASPKKKLFKDTPHFKERVSADNPSSINDLMELYKDIQEKINNIKNKYFTLDKQQLDMNKFNDLISDLFDELKKKSESYLKTDFEKSSNGHVFFFENVSEFLTKTMEIYKDSGEKFELDYNAKRDEFKEKVSRIFDDIFLFSPKTKKKNKEKNKEKTKEKSNKKLIKFIVLFLFGFIEAYISLQLTSQMNYKLNAENLILGNANKTLMEIIESILKSNIELGQFANTVHTNVIKTSLLDGGYNMTFAENMKGSFAADYYGSFANNQNFIRANNKFSSFISKEIKTIKDKNRFTLGYGNLLRQTTIPFGSSICLPFVQQNEEIKASNISNNPNQQPLNSTYNISFGMNQNDNIKKNNLFINHKDSITGQNQNNVDYFPITKKNSIKLGKSSIVVENYPYNATYDKSRKKESKLSMIKQFVVKSLKMQEDFKKEKEYLSLYFLKLIAATEKIIIAKLVQYEVLPEKELDIYKNPIYNSGPEMALLHNLCFGNIIKNQNDFEQEKNDKGTSSQFPELAFINEGLAEKDNNNIPFSTKSQNKKKPLNYINKNDSLEMDENINNGPLRSKKTKTVDEMEDEYIKYSQRRSETEIGFRNNLSGVVSFDQSSSTFNCGDLRTKSINSDIESIINDYIETGTATRKFDGISFKVENNKIKYSYNSGLSASNIIRFTPLEHKLATSKGDVSVESIHDDE